MDVRRLVAATVRRFRLAAGMSEEALAERSGFGEQYISDLEWAEKGHYPSLGEA